MTVLLAVERLSLRFGGVTALEDVSLTVDAGERVALVGPNGAGKTSLLNCLSGVERPSSGRILLRGLDLAGVPPRARAGLGVARTLQGLGLVDDLDVAGNLLLGRHHLMRAGAMAAALRLPAARTEEADHRRACEVVAAELGLGADLRLPAGGLPAGARKRLELGRALVAGAGLLLLDEPFAGAGREDVEVMVGAIRRAAEAGAAVVVVDHDRDVVLALADRVVALEAGRLAVAT